MKEEINISATPKPFPWGRVGMGLYSDPVGSTNYITNYYQEYCQRIEYFPFGEVMFEERKNRHGVDYLFSAKELDAESGLYYFGKRYYDPVRSIFRQSDPLADLQLWQSPYAYCSNNPINRVDPTGLTDYDVSSKGHIVERNPFLNAIKRLFGIKDKEDRLIAANGKVHTMKGGAMGDVKEFKNGNEIEGHYFNVSDDKSAAGIHDFLSENTDVEWGMTEYGSSNSSGNIISTSHDKTTESIMPKIATNLLNKGFNVPRLTHSHLNGELPSGFSVGDIDSGDRDFANYLNEHHPNNNIIQRVYDVKNKRNIYYNSNKIYRYEPKK